MMQAIKVMVITPQYAPDFGPSTPIYTALCEDLRRLGLAVTVITAFPHYAGSNRNFKYPRKFFMKYKSDGVSILRTYIYSMPKSSALRRLFHYGSFNFFSTMAAFAEEKPNIFLADAPVLWSGMPLLMRAISMQIPFIYVVHDIYPDVLLRLGVVSNKGFLKLFGGVENFFYNRASKVSVLSEGFSENLVRKGIPKDKIAIIPACVDTDFIRPLPRENELRSKWKLENKFVILYAGNFGLSQGLETILDGAAVLKTIKDIVFVFVGNGTTRDALIEVAEKKGLSNVRFFPFEPRERVPWVYALADVCLVSLRRDIVVESVPSKSYSIMASGRPMLATVDSNSEVGRLINQVQCGLLVEPENPHGLAQAIRGIYENRLLGEEMGKRGRDYVVKNFSRQVAAMDYYKLIKKFAK
jgi:colanic acid biosynthesis glycosyl transferase WcaI